MPRQLSALMVLVLYLNPAGAANFPWETSQLSETEAASWSDISFGNASQEPIPPGPECKVLPGDTAWPTAQDWVRLNSTLDGALLRPEPAGAVCYANNALYNRERCDWILGEGGSGRFWIDDPLNVLTRWPQGDSCPVEPRPRGNCTRGGFADYVVDARTVKHIQVAVNFARNRDIRLVIKNTGHDFHGKSCGKGSISIWTHHLKSFEFIPSLTIPSTTPGDPPLYSGMAARVSSGLESWEMYAHMRRNNMHLAVPGDSTVGAYGGWMLGGGHHSLASHFGLGSDQPLVLQVVTADGRFATADHLDNSDLFFSLRGGGPSTYGVVTSAVVKAYPALEVSQTSVRFSTSNINGSAAHKADVFWQGASAVYWFSKHATDARGTVYDNISPSGSSSFTFSAEFELPNFTKGQADAWIRTLVDNLRGLGISVSNPAARASPRSSDGSQGRGDQPGNTRFSSRLFPRMIWEDEELFSQTMSVVEEGGYTFHGIHQTPKPAVAGWPGKTSGVNPAFRLTQMHAEIFDRSSVDGTPAQWMQGWSRLNQYTQRIRDVTPDGGAYVNEADRLEPDWQQSFYGDNYQRLAEIKSRWDPWGLFWAPITPGSEKWEVRTADGLPTQNGPLCRTGTANV
ncbi:hypothetical protein MCOR02_012220 [Pyricularia oryzae]|nr:hypothetical protein MCOR02_012220 [Pyricularia oryzae]QBZ61908.1 hypothetical protein PoMZ_08869 [Pyricularia oryzae]